MSDSRPSIRLAIGILAYNESSSIAKTIGSIFGQSIFNDLPPSIESIEVVCVANGCTDNTAEVAARAFAAVGRCCDGRVNWRVEELRQGGKTNAWNEFVHRRADPLATHILMMDGDIRVEHPDTFTNLLSAFDGAPELFSASPLAIKHIELKAQKSILNRVAILLGEINRARPHASAGCCYLLRGDIARRIWFPEGMVGEDSFLGGMVLTELCRSKQSKLERIAKPANATVVFEAYTRVPKMYRILRRQAVTRGTNAILWTYLWANVGDVDAGEIIRRKNESEPGWYGRLICEHVERSGWWVMPRGVVTKRLRFLRHVPGSRRLLLAPVALLGCLVDLVVHIDANRMIRRGRVSGLWEAKTTTQL